VSRKTKGQLRKTVNGNRKTENELSMAKEKKPVEQNFEALLKRLEAVLDSLEHGDLPLEQAMAAFEEGVGLVRACHQKLDEVERRVELLLKDDAGRFFTRPFPEEEGEGN
jgi:exodeoxyribonuclease VII small subunit